MQTIVCSGGGGGPTAGTMFLRYVVKIVLPSRLCTGPERVSCRASSSVLAVLAKRVDDRQEGYHWDSQPELTILPCITVKRRRDNEGNEGDGIHKGAASPFSYFLFIMFDSVRAISHIDHSPRKRTYGPYFHGNFIFLSTKTS